MTCLSIVLIAGLFLFIKVVPASLMAVDGPGVFPGGWSQEWNEGPPYNVVPRAPHINNIEVSIETWGESFASPPISFGTVGWISTDVNRRNGPESGRKTTRLDFSRILPMPRTHHSS